MKLKVKITIIFVLAILIFISTSVIFIPFDNFNEFIETNFLRISISIIVFIITLATILFFLTSFFTLPLKRIKETLTKINSKEENVFFNFRKNKENEITDIYIEIDKAVKYRNELVEFATRLIDGKFDYKESEILDQTILGEKMAIIKEILIKNKEENKDREEENKKIHWIQSGLANFSTLLQQDFKNTKELSEMAIKALVKYLKVEQGGIFVLKNDVLILEASYAYDKKKALDSKFNIGEGLIGKCAKEKQILIFDNIPEGYTFIGSGFGEDSPKSLLIIPLTFENKTFGVLEIASLYKISDHKIHFIEDIGKRIAADIANLNQKTLAKEMSVDLKKQAAKLIEKEKDSIKTIEELKKVQKEIDTQTRQNNAIMNAITSIVSVVLYDLEGRVISFNKKNEDFNIKKEDYVGKTHFDYLKEAKENPEWFINFWADVRNGKTRKKEFYLKDGNNEMWLLETYSLILDKDGNPEKIINIGIDITKQKQLEKKLNN